MEMSERRRLFSVRFALVIPLGALLLFVSPFRAAEPIPARLTDEAFWQFIEDSSEPGGIFPPSENLLSNERGFQYVIPPVLEKVKSEGVYLGVGPEQNFTYVAVFHSKIAFIIDIRRQNMILHLLYKSIFELAPDRIEFLSRLFARKPPPTLAPGFSVKDLFDEYDAVPMDPVLFARTLKDVKDLLWNQHKFGLTEEDAAALEHVYESIAIEGPGLGYSVTRPVSIRFPTYVELMTETDSHGTNWSYLSNEDRYRTVRELEQKNLIVPLVGDFAGPKAIRAVAKYLKDHSATASLFYLSNVEQYLTPAETFKRFYGNVAELPLNPSSMFIRSYQGTGAQPGIAQSTFSPIQVVLEAVLDGRVQNQVDILRLFFGNAQ
jgi:hypothetical protein